MSIVDNWNNPNLKYCNLAILSIFGLVQSARYFINRNSSDVVESYLRVSNSDKLSGNEAFSDSFLEKTSTKNNIKLKKIDSKQFWAILEDQKTNEQIYMKSNKTNPLKMDIEKIKRLKKEPYLLKKKVLESFNKADESVTGKREWAHVKTVPKLSREQSNPHSNELIVLLLIALAGVSTVGYKSVNYIKTMQCINFIKQCCKKNKRVSDILGHRMVLRNLDGELRTNYFNGDVILSGSNGKELLVVSLHDYKHFTVFINIYHILFYQLLGIH